MRAFHGTTDSYYENVCGTHMVLFSWTFSWDHLTIHGKP